ncbi:GDP-mannose 4,6-dehydratase [Filimonas effusa]|uniref:NAD-dependent epimerase/dehydratase family protein n=1 Tax=Filimonas effusa TaxID=2508721 RepID=A0A4Q1DAB2_9BACT|nr:GDP-mannose 4,6-dehydratase [Filimonas effusa]RXK86321.1 NAD-dependent epimerase/dehydratase family protein [Filimonas effusa]
MRILLTGGAGFIGSRVAEWLLEAGEIVTIIDSMDNFYDTTIKLDRLQKLSRFPGFRFLQYDIRDIRPEQPELNGDYDAIIHLAGKAGVRQSIKESLTYEEVNIGGTMRMLEYAVYHKIPQFVFASSSSVYGINPSIPWKEDSQPMPVSPYASSKLAAEAMGYTYSHLYPLRFMSLRFFSVYGEGQRPDLAIHKFTEAIEKGDPVVLYGDGDTTRDYTHVDDIASGIIRALHYDKTSFEIFNLGNHQAIALSELVVKLENIIGKKAIIQRQERHPADVPHTYASIDKAVDVLGYVPSLSLEDGLTQFYHWYLQEHMHQSAVTMA